MIQQILLALILAGSIGAVAGYLGSLMLTKRMALTGGALGHLTMPGIALALLYDFDVSIGAALFLGIGTLIIWYLEQKTKLHLEALTAVVFSASLATAFLFLPSDDIDIALLGDLSGISPAITLVTFGVSAALFLIIKSIYADTILIGISSDLAQSRGIDLKRQNFIYLLCIAVTVALGVRVVGGLMTAALLAIPACTARNISTNLTEYAWISAFAGGIACLVGVIGFAITEVPAGPLIIITGALLFVVSIIVKPRSQTASQRSGH